MLIDRPFLERQILKYGIPKPKQRSIGQAVLDVALEAAKWQYKPLIMGGKAVVDLLTGSPDSPKPVVQVVASAEDIAGLTFPPDHPVSGCVYVVNPVRHDTYIPFSQYHRVVLHEKVAELFSALASLRAKHAVIRVARGGMRSAGLELGAMIPPQVPVQLRLGGGARRSSQEFLEYDVHFDGSGEPRPPDLRWFAQDTSWQALVRGRLDQGLMSFKFLMCHQESAAVSAQLGLELEGQGYSLGGSFQKHEAEEWHIQVDFARKPIFGW